MAMRRKGRFATSGNLTIPAAEFFKNKCSLVKNSGHHYTYLETETPMVEYRVDCCKTFQEKMNRKTKCGGNLSIRMPKGVRPLISIGQDEAIFKQYIFRSKTWVGPNGECIPVPKDVKVFGPWCQRSCHESLASDLF
eukprot:scaffold152391_cov51-Attheya_sp.AAC.1